MGRDMDIILDWLSSCPHCWHKTRRKHRLSQTRQQNKLEAKTPCLLPRHQNAGDAMRDDAWTSAGSGPQQNVSAADSSHERPSRLVSAPKAVDRRVYDQVAASRNRLSKQLSAKNKYIRHLEAEVAEWSEAVEEAHKTLSRVKMELQGIQRLSEVAVAAASFAADKAEGAARSDRIAKRAASLQQGLEKEIGTLDQLMVRKVPISWYGVASDVKLFGSFDSWTQGFSLSPCDLQDRTFTVFSAEIQLKPGTYLVKFKIDDTHWRLAPDWPTQAEENGTTNNVLLVS